MNLVNDTMKGYLANSSMIRRMFEAGLELKKKYDKIVYKRRYPICEKDAMEWITNDRVRMQDTQISREIDYFINFYAPLKPSVFLSYERDAYYCKSDSDFRVTFDDNILCRRTDISLCSDIYGSPILPEGKVLMELKCSGGIPMWMVSLLSKEKIYRTSFSKYGTAYEKLIFPDVYLPNSMKI